MAKESCSSLGGQEGEGEEKGLEQDIPLKLTSVTYFSNWYHL
jgi:hypothetical protein